MFFHNYKAYTANIDLRRVEIKEIEKIIKTGENTLTTHNFLFIKNTLSLSKIGLKKIWKKLNINAFRNFLIINRIFYK